MTAIINAKEMITDRINDPNALKEDFDIVKEKQRKSHERIFIQDDPNALKEDFDIEGLVMYFPLYLTKKFIREFSEFSVFGSAYGNIFSKKFNREFSVFGSAYGNIFSKKFNREFSVFGKSHERIFIQDDPNALKEDFDIVKEK
ncbi:hypothetical protein Glove_60g107 [Diversispora epigaea]|uniref:Uncharacterized protein n=1 Tax=Diversispora epigaea TaxID=1348612 RepID=A0A397JBU7_9GLOM|nr:hypothetical protein Glove_60g107 [Diversispora epigaea]